MRTLLLLRGSPGCGKTTWIEQNGLKRYTLSADDIRMMCSSPSLNALGQYEISQANDTVVWSILFRLLEVRMQNGEFTVIDATNSKTSEMNRYKERCGAYKYRIFCVDFTDIPIEVAKERNRQREELKRVPEDVIDKIYSRFQTQKIPSGITVIKPDELDRVWMKMFDMCILLRYTFHTIATDTPLLFYQLSFKSFSPVSTIYTICRKIPFIMRLSPIVNPKHIFPRFKPLWRMLLNYSFHVFAP